MAGPIFLTWAGQTPMLDMTEFTQGDLGTPPARGIVYGDGVNAIVAQVAVDEDHDDDLIITEHPISGGAVIHDHAYKRPAECRVRMGWSNAYLSDIGVQDVRQLYEQILSLQVSRVPCTLFTGKRQYQNMLVAGLRTHTDASLEFSIIADITFREVVLTSTSAWTLSQVEYNQGALADPQGNSQTIQMGQIYMLPASVQTNYVPQLYNVGFGPGDEALLPHIATPPGAVPWPDHPADPQQSVFHPLPSRVMGR